MVFAHRSFAPAALVGSLFGQLLSRLVRLQLVIIGKTKHFWKQCLVFCSIVFQIRFCQVFGQPILSCRSLALVLARGNLMEFRMAVLSDARLASACAMSTSRPYSVGTFTYNSTCHELTGKSHACSFWPCRLQQTFFWTDPNRNLMILVQIICLKMQSRMTYADS